MRRVDVVRPPINYAITGKWDHTFQVAWFMSLEDAEDFFKVMSVSDKYEIAEVRR